MYNSYLCHYGVNGQKWGVRRYQNEDGSYKSGAEGRYYDEVGEQRSRNKKLMIVGAALIGAAALGTAAYVAYKYADENKDLTISVNDTIQRIERTDSGELHDMAYVAVTDHDKKLYEKLYGGQLKQGEYGNVSKKAFKMNISATSDLKIASEGNAKKVFDELISTNKEFAEWAEANRFANYSDFNHSIMTSKKSEQFSIFTNAMKAKGYAGIIDVNDKRDSGYGAQAPAIIFDPSSLSVKSISDADADFAGGLKMAQKAMSKKMTIDSAPQGILAAGAAGVMMYVSSSNSNKELEAMDPSVEKKKAG